MDSGSSIVVTIVTHVVRLEIAGYLVTAKCVLVIANHCFFNIHITTLLHDFTCTYIRKGTVFTEIVRIYLHLQKLFTFLIWVLLFAWGRRIVKDFTIPPKSS